MRALFVAPYLPTHGSGGRTRFVNLLEHLGRAHEIRVVAFRAPDQSKVQDPAWRAFPPPALRPRPGGWRGRIRFYGEKLRPLPAYASWFHDDAFAAAISAEVASFKPDVVQIETTEMAQYLRAASGVPRVLDLQDLASRWFGRVATLGATRQERALMRIEAAKARAYERRSARAAEAVLVCSDDESSYLREMSGVTPTVVPNGVDVAGFMPRPDVREDDDVILFVGPLTYAANSDGLGWFTREVLPLVRAEIPGARVEQIGVGDAASYGDGVVHLGMVDDVRPHLARAPLSIVPVRIGTGTRYKILEALSMERAVVSTTIGAESLGLRDGEHIRIADGPADFARAVVDLLRDPAQRAHLGAAGRAHVAARYDWGGVVSRVEAVWATVTRG